MTYRCRPPYKTDYPVCVDCGLMFTAAALQNGKCRPCRDGIRIRLSSLLFWLLAVAAVFVFVYFARPAIGDDSLAQERCYVNGDWRETPYCTAAAKDMPQ